MSGRTMPWQERALPVSAKLILLYPKGLTIKCVPSHNIEYWNPEGLKVVARSLA